MSRVYRKNEHLKYAVESYDEENPTWFNNIQFVHQALLGGSFKETSINTKLGNLNLNSPIIINAMTGGSNETKIVNEQLASIAVETGVAMAVGSQMSGIKNSIYRSSYEIVRKVNPKGIIIANIGAEASVNQAKEVIEMIEADALQIHINPIQELIMSEGDRDFKKYLENIRTINDEIRIPVIVKEVGYGISKEVATLLNEIGISIIDVGGKGGTDFSLIENKRRDYPISIFNDWGIETVASILEVKEVSNIEIIATGGIRNSLEIAKAIGLGASATGLAGVILKKLADCKVKGTIKFIDKLHTELQILMTSLGAKKLSDLQHRPMVASGELRNWCEVRDISLHKIAQRKF